MDAKLVFVIASAFCCLTVFAAGNEKIIYKYKKYEKFDFDEMVVGGDSSSPGDISIMHRFQRKYKNRLHERKNFNIELRRAVSRIK